MSNIPIPRFQGNSFEKDGGWSFEIFVSMLGEDEGKLFKSKKIYSTKEEAIHHIKLTIQKMIKSLSKDIEYINPDEYIDMKTNSTRRWDKKNEQ